MHKFHFLPALLLVVLAGLCNSSTLDCNSDINFSCSLSFASIPFCLRTISCTGGKVSPLGCGGEGTCLPAVPRGTRPAAHLGRSSSAASCALQDVTGHRLMRTFDPMLSSFPLKLPRFATDEKKCTDTLRLTISLNRGCCAGGTFSLPA